MEIADPDARKIIFKNGRDAVFDCVGLGGGGWMKGGVALWAEA